MPKKSVIVIGAGFTGLVAAWYLQKNGYHVTVIEAAKQPGGLAAGFKEKKWNWTVEHHYHHIFESDKDFLNFLKDCGLSSEVIFKKTTSRLLYKGKQYQLDSPSSLLRFPKLPLLSKLRVATTLAFLKYSWSWKWLETQTAKSFLIKTMGEKAWKILWAPLFVAKFGKYYEHVNAAWFWARIKARTKKLGYFKNGFGGLANKIAANLKEAGVIIKLGEPVQEISKNKSFTVKTKKLTYEAQTVLVTAPSTIFSKLVPSLEEEYIKNISRLKGLAAQTLVLELSDKFFNDDTYWLNINEQGWPFLAVVEHTNFVENDNYNNKHILYVGSYLDLHDDRYTLNKEELLELYMDKLSTLNKDIQKITTNSWLFKAPFAQPIPYKKHSQYVPEVQTPIEGLYWASMQHVYPWDRGTNFAVKLGKDVADMIVAKAK